MKILLVDDDTLICENVKSKLQRVAEGEKLVCRILPLLSLACTVSYVQFSLLL